MDLRQLIEISNRYGKDEDYVLLGGGNTSVKGEGGLMFVKGSGCALADVTEKDFVPVDWNKLAKIVEKPYPADDDAREAEVLEDVMAAKAPDPGAPEGRRPSVECVLHAIFPRKYGVHLHPTVVNGLSCAKAGEQKCTEVLGPDVAWAPRAKPGYMLSKACYDVINKYKAEHQDYPKVMILQNHGIFVSSDNLNEACELMESAVKKLSAFVMRVPRLEETPAPQEAAEYAEKLKRLYARENGAGEAVFCTNSLVLEFVKSKGSLKPIMTPYTPDHVVYCKGSVLFIPKGEAPDAAFAEFVKAERFAPKLAAVEGMGFFALGNTAKEAENAKLLFLDAMKITVFAESFGGPETLTRDIVDFMMYWEFEKYRMTVPE